MRRVEAQIRRQIVAALREIGAVVWSQTGAIGGAGRPDLVVCYRGRFIALEIKTPAGRPTPAQLAALDAVRRAGGTAAIVRSAAEAVDTVRSAALPCADHNPEGAS